MIAELRENPDGKMPDAERLLGYYATYVETNGCVTQVSFFEAFYLCASVITLVFSIDTFNTIFNCLCSTLTCQ